MLGVGQDTPTRYELLNMVKKHSKLLGQTNVDEDDSSSDLEMDSRFWHDVMDLYFVRSRESRGRQDDDMVFFVKKMILHEHVTNDKMQRDSPYFVRRWAPKLDDLIGKSSVDVDWRRSFYLNLIAHSTFSVTVAICSHQVLMNRQSGNDAPMASIYKVVKTVYASPSRVDFHLDSKKEAETTPAYPDICFAVDDFDSTFDAVLLTDTDHCYCVLLNIDGGVAFPDEETEQGCSYSSSKTNPGSKKKKKPKITLFSGFVSYQMVRDAYEAGRSGFGSLLSLGNSSSKTDRIYMKGPGGRGEVEVAVSGVRDQSKEGTSPPSSATKKPLNIGKIVRRAASVAKHAMAAAAAAQNGGYEEEMLPLKCCLMSISLPWEHIAHDLLFKGSPTVNL